MKGDCVYTTNVGLDKDGYPRSKHQSRLWRLNRLVYTFVHGDIPTGMVIGHLCNNTGCINPHHLYLCTAAKNSTHAARDGLYKTGFINKKFEQASEDWKTLCHMYHDLHMSQREIGNIYGIHQSRVSELLKKHTSQYLQEIHDEAL